MRDVLLVNGRKHFFRIKVLTEDTLKVVLSATAQSLCYRPNMFKRSADRPCNIVKYAVRFVAR